MGIRNSLEPHLISSGVSQNINLLQCVSSVHRLLAADLSLNPGSACTFLSAFVCPYVKGGWPSSHKVTGLDKPVYVNLLCPRLLFLLRSSKQRANVDSPASFLPCPWSWTTLCACSVAQSCLALCDPMDCSPPGSSVHGILQARILQWVAMPSSRGSSPTQGSNLCLLNCRGILYLLRHLGSPLDNSG